MHAYIVLVSTFGKTEILSGNRNTLLRELKSNKYGYYETIIMVSSIAELESILARMSQAN